MQLNISKKRILGKVKYYVHTFMYTRTHLNEQHTHRRDIQDYRAREHIHIHVPTQNHIESCKNRTIINR